MKKILFTLFVIGCLANTNAQVPSYVPTNGLVGYWPFNGNANDESGNGNNGTVNGATLTTDKDGNENSAYSFDGVDDYIEISNYSEKFEQIVSEITISTWFKDDKNDHGTIIARRNFTSNPTGERHHFEVTLGPNNSITYSSYNNIDITKYNIQLTTDENLFEDGIWNSLIVKFDSNKNGLLSIYLNGMLIINKEFPGQILSPNQHWINIGRIHRANGNPFFSEFKGHIDDIAIWNRALTEQEIANLYASNSSNECSTLVINTGVLSTSPVTYTSTVNIYPNPANDQITIDCGNIDNVDGWRIKINNMLGQEVFNEPMDTQQYVIPLNTWTGQGMYFVKIINAENEVVNIKKIILQ